MNKLNGNCDQSLTEEYLMQEMSEANEILPKWDGGNAYVASFDLELFDVTIFIEDGDNNTLAINCSTPIRMNGPFEWRNSKIRIENKNSNFSVVDIGSGFILEASVISVYEKL